MTLSLFAIFGAGLLTFLSPCVLPLVPIYLATLAGGALETSKRGRLLVVALAFVAGLSSVFVALGALASTLGGALLAHRLGIAVFGGVLMVVFGLRALGAFRSETLDREARPALARIGEISTVGGAFVFGAAFAFGWSPCIGPVLASVLTFAASHAATPWRGAGYLAVYAAGLSLPLLLVALGAAQATAALRRLRGFLPRFEKATGLVLIGLGLWTSGEALWTEQSAPAPSAVAATPTTVSTSTPPPSASAEASVVCEGGNNHFCALPTNEPPAPAAAETPLADRGVHRVLAFTGHSCAVCRRMVPVLEKVAATCGVRDETFVNVDVASSVGRSLVSRYGVVGTPTFVLLDASGEERGRILGELAEADVVETVNEAFGSRCASPRDPG